MASKLKIRVRTYECDSYGHVNNANYLNYLEYARYEFLKDIGFDYKAALLDGYGIYIARIEIDYKRSAHADEEITVLTEPVKAGSVSGVVSQIITRGEDVLIESKVTWAFVNKDGTPARIPEKYSVQGLKP
ncbi:MAG: thioesterase family protein [Termitinemataceae bacterium]|nr:MAG: thioesterase family protein [Termitinemataceae bacterium]